MRYGRRDCQARWVSGEGGWMSSQGCEYSRRQHSRTIPWPCSTLGKHGRGIAMVGDLGLRGANKATETREAKAARNGSGATVTGQGGDHVLAARYWANARGSGPGWCMSWWCNTLKMGAANVGLDHETVKQIWIGGYRRIAVRVWGMWRELPWDRGQHHEHLDRRMLRQNVPTGGERSPTTSRLCSFSGNGSLQLTIIAARSFERHGR